MSLYEPQGFVRHIELDRRDMPTDDYPYCIPAIRNLTKLQMHPKVTFLVGENGSGKSTLLEAIAVSCGFNAEGGDRNHMFSTRNTHSELHSRLRVARGHKREDDGFFLRAESMYNTASYLEDSGATRYGRSLHKQSHGESFLTVLKGRFMAKGLYILDEPEAALSPTRQLSVLRIIHDLVEQDAQFIIATHSPILMAFPDALIYLLSEGSISPVNYTETEHYCITKVFLNKYESMLNTLFEDESQDILD